MSVGATTPIYMYRACVPSYLVKGPTGFRTQCTYNLSDINRSIPLSRERHNAALKLLAQRKDRARRACDAIDVGVVGQDFQGVTLGSGGWCLGVNDRIELFHRSKRQVALPSGGAYWLPAGHMPADDLVIDLMRALTTHHPEQGLPYLSIADVGAGVGQYGHLLQSLDSRIVWHGYDGAGDVEQYTDGFVKFVDLTIPLSLPRADWVLSLEVGEHVPPEHENTFVRNLHALNCRGIVLSWADYGGHQHVNKRGKDYLVEVFSGLGYAYNANISNAAKATRFRDAYKSDTGPRGLNNHLNRSEFTVLSWLGRSIMVFDRITPLGAPGCTPPHPKDASRLEAKWQQFNLPPGRVRDAVRLAHVEARKAAEKTQPAHALRAEERAWKGLYD